ncbi:MAG: hypothetical protein AAF471_00790 [Myxococcota bacterium]
MVRELVKWSTILSLVCAGGCNITNTISRNLAPLDIDKSIQEAEEKLLNQILPAEEDRADESLKMKMKTESCEVALFSYLLKVGQPDETKRTNLPSQFPANASSKDYAPGNPNSCDNVDVEKKLSDLLLQQMPPSFVFSMPSPSATATERELNPTMQQCLDLMNDPTFLRVVDLRLKMVADDSKRRSTVKVFPKGTVYAVNSKEIKGFDWHPSKEKVDKLKSQGILRQVAETKEARIDNKTLPVLQIDWVAENKRRFFDDLVAKKVGLLLVTESLIFERAPEKDGSESLRTPAGKIALRAELDVSIQVRTSDLNCASVIFQYLRQ